LTDFLESTPNTVVMTMPPALNRQIIDRDLSPFFVPRDDKTAFHFLGHLPHQVEGQRWGLDHILERTAITREVCARVGVRVIDLFAALDTENATDFREHFVDVLHLRPRSYPLVAQIIYDNIKDLAAEPRISRH